MRIIVSTRSQTEHRTSRTIAKILASAHLAKWCGQNKIELICDWTWQQIKTWLRSSGAGDSADGGSLNPDSQDKMPIVTFWKQAQT